MKIRTGFVSNSSSSSFIVVFPYKPRSVEDVLKYMFNGKDGVLTYYDHSLTHREIAAIVFADIKRKKANKKELVDDLAGRYYFSEHSKSFPYHIEDCHGRDSFFGLDIEMLDELRELTLKSYDEEKAIEKEIEKRIDSKLPKVPYAHKTKDGKDTTESKAFETYMKKREKLQKDDPELVALKTKRWKVYEKYSSRIRKLEKQLAEKDLAALKEKYAGGYIAHLSYSDNDSQNGCTMEHGEIFRNLPHIRISHH